MKIRLVTHCSEDEISIRKLLYRHAKMFYLLNGEFSFDVQDSEVGDFITMIRYFTSYSSIDVFIDGRLFL